MRSADGTDEFVATDGTDHAADELESGDHHTDEPQIDAEPQLDAVPQLDADAPRLRDAAGQEAKDGVFTAAGDLLDEGVRRSQPVTVGRRAVADQERVRHRVTSAKRLAMSRVVSADETAESVRRAQRALVELRQRQAIEERRAAGEARDEELGRWHTDTAHEPAVADRAVDATAHAEPVLVLEVTPSDGY